MKNTYYNPSAKDFPARWYIIDAKGQRLGKVATKAAMLLMGKHDPSYVPHLDNGHRVVVINAAHVDLLDRKLEQKTYYRHTGYPGGLRRQTLADLHGQRPGEVIRKAVKGMLPKNRLGTNSLNKLYIYAEADHGQQAQKPEVITL